MHQILLLDRLAIQEASDSILPASSVVKDISAERAWESDMPPDTALSARTVQVYAVCGRRLGKTARVPRNWRYRSLGKYREVLLTLHWMLQRKKKILNSVMNS